MAQVTDFNKLRKKRRRGMTLKRLLILGLIAAGLLAVLSINNLLLEVGMLTRLSDFVRGFGGGGYPIPVPGGVLRDVKSLGGNLCVLNDTNLYVYNQNGKQINAPQRTGESTVMETGGGHIFLYELGGTRYTIHSQTKLLLEGTAEYSLMGGSINARGDYALICSARQYVSDVTVYDSRNTQQFQWKSSEELVTGVSISPQGGRMSACSVGARGGLLLSSVLLFEFTQDNALARVEFPDELVIWTDYRVGGIGVLTDRQYRVLTESGEVAVQHEFGGSRLVLGCLRDGMLLLLTENTETRTQLLTLYGKDGAELGSMAPDKTIRDMQLGSRAAYLLTDDGVITCDLTLSEQEAKPAPGATRIHSAGDKLYYFTSEEVHLLN